MARSSHVPQVLVIGYRKGLIDALVDLQASITLWTDRPLKHYKRFDQVWQAPFSKSKKTIMEFLEGQKKDGRFDFVIAGVEKGVLPASIARKHFHARQSVHSVSQKCHDKWEMKNELSKYNIPMAKYAWAKQVTSAKDCVEQLGLPVVIKKRKESGGFNMSIAHQKDALEPFLGKNYLFESFNEGMEFSVESFVHHGKIVFTNITQYFEKLRANVVPYPLADDLAEKILKLNQKIIQSLKISWGMTHAEFYLSKTNTLKFGEIALRPPGGYIMELIQKAYNFSPWAAYVAVEMNRPFDFGIQRQAYAGVYILSADEGEIINLKGFDELKNKKTYVTHFLKLKKGQRVKKKVRAGDDIGRVMFCSSNDQDLYQDLLWAKKHLFVETLLSEHNP